MPNLLYRGKVRDSYDLGDKLLIVVTDRISAFDYVLPNAIPYKGNVLNQLSAFWFDKTGELVPNHCIKVIYDVKELNGIINNPPEYLAGRSMIVKKAKLIEIECIVRGYLAGSAWSEYKATGIVNGVPLVKGLIESSPLVEPMFTPTIKAANGHDQPLLIKDMV
ncbi:MAG: phosphoribosylaminoimidazolesuccinocarboxamide synthase, partial [Chloroflexi bacterium]|nr:phosphoribosylaminoimidazolesuccinocarboxamide synthase [Chloroflexota bacterium]